jgi:hypothetical protein
MADAPVTMAGLHTFLLQTSTRRKAITAAAGLASAAPLVGLLGRATSVAAQEATPTAAGTDDVTAVATAAYLYFYSLVTMDVTRRQTTNVAPGKMFLRGPMNTFSNATEYPAADVKLVVRPNFDTLYSSGWLDLTKEPVIVSAPDTAGRYYLLPMLDMWTDVFASPGKRTTGTGAGHFGLIPPGWTGDLPEGVARIDAPTPYVWIIGRTQTNGPADYDAVHRIQDGYTITPLSQWGKTPQPVTATIDPSVDMKTPPLEQVNGMAGADYFHYAAELMKLHSPHITDEPIVAQMQRVLGLTAGESFDPAQADPAVQAAIEQAPAAGLKRMNATLPNLAPVVNGWQMNTSAVGVYGTDYLKRAIISMAGLGANLPEDAIYPLNFADSEGQPLTGTNRYVLSFAKGEEPPVDAFWSVTLYDEQGFQVANALNRFAISSWMPLTTNPDGSLDLLFQHESPGAEKESNWLPAPAGSFNLTMRLYAPRQAALDGTWAPPAIKKAS